MFSGVVEFFSLAIKSDKIKSYLMLNGLSDRAITETLYSYKQKRNQTT